MSTRFQIAAVTSGHDGQAAACIYVHCDGYPECALATLQQHYTDQAKIDRLVALGDCILIASKVELCDTFRKRGEDWEKIRPSLASTPAEAADLHRHGDEQYRYIWDGRQWLMERL